MQTRLDKRKKQGLFRTLSNKRPSIDFASNDTLGLGRSKQLQMLAMDELETLRSQTGLTGFCASGSRLFSGNHPYCMRLEEEIACFHGFNTATLFSCGYMANLGLLSSLSEDALFLFDAKVHASTRDGISLSKAPAFPFRHNDLAHLEKRLLAAKGNVFVCIESIYSTDGSVAPLEKIASLTKKFGANLVVDETHAIGAFGPQGKGLIAEKQLQDQVFAVVASLAKAFGCYGAVCLGNSLLRDYLINFARSFIYTTALPLQNLAPIRAAYQLIPQMDTERLKLYTLMGNRPSHIFSILIRGKVMECVRYFGQQNFAVSPLRSPTTRSLEEGVRICLHSTNTQEELEKLTEIIKAWRQLHG